MIKKAIIVSFTFFALSLGTLYTAYQGRDLLTDPANDAVVVLELFTSQGCSSCPPADALLEQVKEAYPSSVFALSYHVDYWDYIGWKDPFGSEKNTERQRMYAQKFNQRSLYTPEMVINGKEHFVGSNGSVLKEKLQSYLAKTPSVRVSITNVLTHQDKITFSYALSDELIDKRLRAILVLDQKQTQVNRGENKNRTLRNSNIVVEEKYLSQKGETGFSSIYIPETILKGDHLSLLLIVENENRDVLGASKKTIDR
ncbi:DUF1223 domain-containing protein [Flagellimonas beolgyonensis]|uniref:DUF1223 domain-containing protein n=1 Tax=Flagellimonas beolgyonensis TaxID=864064 RepID=UPI000F8F075B|nr:DUF1223 domain-containing protein [Allomuricauda beolgyonensis]